MLCNICFLYKLTLLNSSFYIQLYNNKFFMKSDTVLNPNAIYSYHNRLKTNNSTYFNVIFDVLLV